VAICSCMHERVPCRLSIDQRPVDRDRGASMMVHDSLVPDTMRKVRIVWMEFCINFLRNLWRINGQKKPKVIEMTARKERCKNYDEDVYTINISMKKYIYLLSVSRNCSFSSEILTRPIKF